MIDWMTSNNICWPGWMLRPRDEPIVITSNILMIDKCRLIKFSRSFLIEKTDRDIAHIRAVIGGNIDGKI